MREGISNAAASRIVGVNRKTGHRWRYGRSVTTRTGEVRTYPAITRPADPVSARYLSEAERISIADELIRGLGVRAIAAELGRAPSTISREIRRNRDAGTGTYQPHQAQRRAAGRRIRHRRGKLGSNIELRTVVADHLERRWSPEQISRLLPSLFDTRPEMRVAPETIYQALYARGPDRLQRDGVRLLRSGRVHRKRRRRSGERLGRFVAPTAPTTPPRPSARRSPAGSARSQRTGASCGSRRRGCCGSIGRPWPPRPGSTASSSCGRAIRPRRRPRSPRVTSSSSRSSGPWRDLKTTLELRPVYHRRADRIRAHVLLCWLALLLVRIAETATGETWRTLRFELDKLHLGRFAGSAGEVHQRTELTARQVAILKDLDVAEPPRIFGLAPSVAAATA